MTEKKKKKLPQNGLKCKKKEKIFFHFFGRGTSKMGVAPPKIFFYSYYTKSNKIRRIFFFFCRKIYESLTRENGRGPKMGVADFSRTNE